MNGHNYKPREKGQEESGRRSGKGEATQQGQRLKSRGTMASLGWKVREKWGRSLEDQSEELPVASAWERLGGPELEKEEQASCPTLGRGNQAQRRGLLNRPTDS